MDFQPYLSAHGVISSDYGTSSFREKDSTQESSGAREQKMAASAAFLLSSKMCAIRSLLEGRRP